MTARNASLDAGRPVAMSALEPPRDAPGVALQIVDLGVDLPRASDRAPRRLLHGIDLTVRARTVVGVLGDSGAGKSVMARAICNAIDKPLIAHGHVGFGGRNLLDLPPAAMVGLWGRRIAYIGADPTRHFDPTLPVGHQIVEKLRAVEPGVGREQATRRVLALLDEVRIPDARARFHDLPQQYSGGMIQRAAIADALITDPELLIADSITQPLDTTVAAQILRLLHALRARFHTATVFFSASPAVIADIADEVLVLENGSGVEHGSVREVLHAPRHEATRRMLAELPRVWRVDPTAPSGHDRREETSLATPLLQVLALRKSYARAAWGSSAGQRRVRAVRGVSFELQRGEHLGIVGESGCGKSTLSRLLSGQDMPDEGRILFDGRDLADLVASERKALCRRFQLVLPDPYTALPAHWTIGRIIAEPLRIHGLPDGASSERASVLAALGEVGLSATWYERLPGGLSAGQRQRVNLARALVLKPELLILDETLSALSAGEQHQLLALFGKLQRERGLSTIFISHDLAMLRSVCDRIAVMYLGRIVELGPNRPTFFDPLHPYTRALLAALPVLEPNPFVREQCLLDGETPNPIDVSPGCSFASRCPQVVAACRQTPPVFSVRQGRGAECHLLEPGGV